MSYLIIDAQGNQKAFIQQPDVIPLDALWHGQPQNLPDEFKDVAQAKDPEGLLAWLYQDPNYLALMDAYPGRLPSFERAISRNRLDAAQVLWDGFTVPTELITKLSQRLPEFGYQDLLDRLYPSPI